MDAPAEQQDARPLIWMLEQLVQAALACGVAAALAIVCYRKGYSDGVADRKRRV